MKTKRPINQNGNLIRLSFLLTLAVLISCSVSKKSVKSTPVSDDEPYVVVEEMPVFPGGDSTLLDYIAKNTKYPEKAKASKIAGKVIVKFCVTATGSVDRVTVIRGVSPELDSEASRVVGTLPAFKPGRQSGKNVAVWYMVPIDFALN